MYNNLITILKYYISIHTGLCDDMHRFSCHEQEQREEKNLFCLTLRKKDAKCFTFLYYCIEDP